MQHDTTRSFFMTVEAPDTIRRGEQIGLRLDIFNNWDQDMEVRLFSFGTTYLMPVTHIPEISTKNSYQKTGTINRHENETHPIRCQKNLVPNCISDASKTGSTSFWHRFLVSVPWALLCAIPFSRGRALPFVCLSVCLSVSDNCGTNSLHKGRQSWPSLL